MGNSQMLHKKTKSLTHLAFRVYCHMKLESTGKEVLTFPRSKYKGFCSAGGFNSAKQELIDAGFIEEIENNAHRKIANVYRFSTSWKLSN